MRAPALLGLLSLTLTAASPMVAAAAVAAATIEPGAGPVAEARPRRVSVGVVDGLGPSADELVRALRGHVADLEATVTIEARRAPGDLGVAVAWGRAALQADADAALWIEPAAADGPATLYLLVGAPPRLYLRRLTLGADPLETEEILGVIVRGTIASLADASEAAPAGMEEAEVPEVADAPADLALRENAHDPSTAAPPAGAEAPQGPPEPRRRGFVGVGYLGQSLAEGAPWASGVGLSGGLVRPRGLLALASAGWALHGVYDPRVGGFDLGAPLRIHRVGLELGLGYRHRLGARDRGFIDAVAGARGEAWIWRPTAGSAATGGGGFRLSLGPGVGGGVDLGRRLAVGAWARLDLWVLQLDLVARTPAGDAALLRPPLAGVSVLAAVLVRLGG